MLRASLLRVVCRFIAVAGICAVAACAADIRRARKDVAQKIADAREQGAYRCAPEDLAQAEANLEFVEHELEQGDARRAQRHLVAAGAHIDAALRATSPEACTGPLPGTDSDGDGLDDTVDQCPTEPEDLDSFEDDNGCPDPDNDGDTVLDAEDTCPLEAGAAANQGCPIQDRDGDAIADNVDRCPDIPEDLDGNDDEDGCPEEDQVDSDGDGMLDRDDTCPLQPGPATHAGCPILDRDGDTVPDDVDACPDVPGRPPRGCPRRVLVEKTADRIEIKRQIRFESNRAIIRGKISFLILDQVSQVLASNPNIKIVIEGHTDSVGPADYNLKLSDQRAAAVREALVERGVDGGRLESIGYGESKPIASNRSRKGRATNRRVEFKIVQTASDRPEPNGDKLPPLAPPPAPPAP